MTKNKTSEEKQKDANTNVMHTLNGFYSKSSRTLFFHLSPSFPPSLHYFFLSFQDEIIDSFQQCELVYLHSEE